MRLCAFERDAYRQLVHRVRKERRRWTHDVPFNLDFDIVEAGDRRIANAKIRAVHVAKTDEEHEVRVVSTAATMLVRIGR